MSAGSAAEPVWISTHGEVKKIHLYFFWSKKCPHCLEARPFLDSLKQQYDWLIIHDKELTEYPDHVIEYRQLASLFNQEPRSVPAFFWCRNMSVGFDDVEHMGEFIKQQLQSCYTESLQGELADGHIANTKNDQLTAFNLPLIGVVTADRFSLPVYTLLLASLDAFNPCAFFVLFFLLGLLSHAKNRRRMLLIGGTFVLISGVMYFVFMAAWLNIFLIIGQINLITLLAGILAVVIASINIKDYFWFKRGFSLSIPEAAKVGLFQRIRHLVNANNLHTMMIATIALAVFANTYELLCTAGFPLVFTRILTFHELNTLSYYSYLALYNIIYVIPLLIIVMLFAKTLGSYKLQEKHGRQLKLVSGLLMLSLGLVLIIAPAWLSNIGVALVMFTVALLISVLIIRITNRKQSE